MPKRNGNDGTASFWGMARSFLYDYCTRVRGLSPKTVEAYRISLECAIGFIVRSGTPKAEITFDDFERAKVKEWVAWMRDGKGYAPKTVGLWAMSFTFTLAIWSVLNIQPSATPVRMF